MKIWTSEHVFSHNWETVVQSQFRKYPNPHNTNVMGTDVLDRHVDGQGRLHSTRIITSDWKLAPWVQRLIGCNKEAYAHEVSVVDPKERLMTMKVRGAPCPCALFPPLDWRMSGMKWNEFQRPPQ